MKKLKSISMVVLMIGLIVTIAGCTQQSSTQKELEEISVRLPIPTVDAGITPFLVAEKNGYYEQENLKVIFNLGGSETNPVKMVASGVDDFGVLGGPDTLLVAKSKNQPLKAVAIIHKNSNFPVLLTLKDSGLTQLEQLQNKKIGFFYGHISTDVLRNLFNKFNIEHEEVDVGFNYSQLVAKKLDAQWAFRTTAGVSLPTKGIEVNIISPADYGIITHGYTIFVTDSTLKNKPEIIERFLRATFKGIEYELNDPERAADILAAKDKKIDRDIGLKKIYLYNEVTSNSTKFPIGYMDYQMFKETYDRLVEEEVIKNQFNVRDVYDVQFLKKIHNLEFND